MEVLIEILIEVFGEIILTILAEAIAEFVRTVDKDRKLKRILKYTFIYSVLGLTILLIVTSLIYAKKFLTIIALSYMLSNLLVRLFKRLNEDRLDNKAVSIVLSILRRLFNYAYPVLLIVFSAIYLTDVAAITTIIIFSSIAIILWFSIDMYKIWKRQQNKIEARGIEKYNQ